MERYWQQRNSEKKDSKYELASIQFLQPLVIYLRNGGPWHSGVQSTRKFSYFYR